MRSSANLKTRSDSPAQSTPGAGTAPSGLPQLLTVKETAAVLRVTTRTVHRLIKSGQLPKLNIGRSVRIDAGALAAVIGPR